MLQIFGPRHLKCTVLQPVHLTSEPTGEDKLLPVAGAQPRQSATTLGLRPGVADADKQYRANSVPDRLLRPALLTGFTPSTDYKIDRVGVKGGAHGALYADGDVYRPSTPKSHLEASKDLQTGVIDIATYRARVQARKDWRLHVKQKATGNGKVILRCPALGPSPTVTCPLREMMVGAAKKARPRAEPVPSRPSSWTPSAPSTRRRSTSPK